MFAPPPCRAVPCRVSRRQLTAATAARPHPGGVKLPRSPCFFLSLPPITAATAAVVVPLLEPLFGLLASSNLRTARTVASVLCEHANREVTALVINTVHEPLVDLQGLLTRPEEIWSHVRTRKFIAHRLLQEDVFLGEFF